MRWPSQVAFEWEAWKRFKNDLRAGAFDVVQRLTPMSPTLPSPLARWSPVPFVLGPINGGLPWPPGFQNELRREREYLRYVRAGYKLLPFYRSTYARSRCILAAFHTRSLTCRPRRATAPSISPRWGSTRTSSPGQETARRASG